MESAETTSPPYFFAMATPSAVLPEAVGPTTAIRGILFKVRSHPAELFFYFAPLDDDGYRPAVRAVADSTVFLKPPGQIDKLLRMA